jgi:SnoaL-like domain
MRLTQEDRAAITELISLHGHLVDSGELDRLDELFTDDITYDLSDFGLGSLEGMPAIRDAALALGEANPVGHHVTNVILTEHADNEAHARSKGIAINKDGTSGSVTYEDRFTRDERGWRIRYRKVEARRAPLGAGLDTFPRPARLPLQRGAPALIVL